MQKTQLFYALEFHTFATLFWSLYQNPPLVDCKLP